MEDVTAATLALVELLNHADKPAGRLSGGMKRKLCGACALIGDPQIVLLDLLVRDGIPWSLPKFVEP